MHPDWDKFNTHCDCIGPAQWGKTSWATHCRRKRMIRGKQVVSISWKADAYEADVAFLSEACPKRKALLLDLSGCDPIVPWNPFALPEGRNLSAHVSNLARVVLQSTSRQQIEDLHTYAPVAEAFFAWLCVSQKTIHECLPMFDFSVQTKRLWFERSAEVPEQFGGAMRRIASLSQREWTMETGVLPRRLRPFATSDVLRWFTSSPKPVQIGTLLKQGYSVFVNGAASKMLPVPSAVIALRLIVSELLLFGVENATNPSDIDVYCDEIQEYCPTDFASLIDTILSARIRITAIHHYMGQFADQRVQDSLMTNAGIKVLFGGLPPEVRRKYAEIAYARQMNTDWKKAPIISFVPEYTEELVESETVSDDYHGITVSSRLRADHQPVITGWQYFTMEEKLSKLAELFLVPPRQFTAIFPNGTVAKYQVPTLRRYLYNSADCLGFRKGQPNSLSIDDAINSERSNRAASPRPKKAGGLFHADR